LRSELPRPRVRCRQPGPQSARRRERGNRLITRPTSRATYLSIKKGIRASHVRIVGACWWSQTARLYADDSGRRLRKACR
jgi:hypothetical protein